MKRAANIIGFIAIDEGIPVRNSGDADPRYRYWANSVVYPIAIFPSRKVARRVKHLLYLRFTGVANGMNPEADEQQRRCFDLWVKRAKELRLAAVRAESPTVADLRRPEASR